MTDIFMSLALLRLKRSEKANRESNRQREMRSIQPLCAAGRLHSLLFQPPIYDFFRSHFLPSWSAESQLSTANRLPNPFGCSRGNIAHITQLIPELSIQFFDKMEAWGAIIPFIFALPRKPKTTGKPTDKTEP